MKRLVKPLGLLLCLAAVMSCSKKVDSVVSDPKIINPISDFTITPDPTDGFTFKYNNLSKNYTKLEWRFGDDTLNTDANPTHTFLATGKYTTDLKTFSSTGNVSHKYVDLFLAPDSIMTVNAAKTGNPYEIKFGVSIKAKIKSILWTINDVDAATSVVTTTKDTSRTPIHKFGIGSFNNFTVTVTTDKGSVVSISRSVTTEGIATDITQSRIAYKTNLDNNTNNVNENYTKLVDGNPKTKFGYYAAFPFPLIYTLQFPAPVTVKLYAIENGNDSESTRDPKEWYIEGSNDGNNWTQLDYRFQSVGFADQLRALGQTSTRYYRFFYYTIATPGAYSYYRWRVTQTFGAFQIEEFQLFK
ncbi:PKD domain-containing protein [Mucilaginibacter sp. UR6-11]|uniref:PKD domain-containing protein n=1 Tax=Mucilaginibacter sp. UR6-11 TaxID=1435644 RepID=UPI001E45FAD4|nr:PKD domain-containing protein [Mucilaginibacter sp. UR6-11]MCC8424888.1 hypothetical protein [Mucilaginibacter sp. UR6-11]